MHYYKLIVIIFLVCTITLPGSVLQKIIRDFIVKYFKVSVQELEYFEINNPIGYTIDQPISSLKQTLAFIFLPFIICTLICVLLTFPFQAIGLFGITDDRIIFIFLLLVWIGISAGIYALPDQEALINLDIQLDKTKVNIWLYSFLRLTIIIFKFMTCFRFNSLIYAFAISYFLPWLFGFKGQLFT